MPVPTDEGQLVGMMILLFASAILTLLRPEN
jgi:hypothetical protein